MNELINELINYKRQSHSWKALLSLFSEEIPRILWILKLYYHTYNNPPLIPILRQIHPLHAPHLIS